MNNFGTNIKKTLKPLLALNHNKKKEKSLKSIHKKI